MLSSVYSQKFSFSETCPIDMCYCVSVDVFVNTSPYESEGFCFR
nr:MAG TPA: hypothetical protein [Caudoviricetes sp.]